MQAIRIMCVGPGRLNEAMVTLSCDHRIYPKIDKTYIISPYPEDTARQLMHDFGIDDQTFEVLSDAYFDQYYDISQWKCQNWYKQQAFKLCALDHFDNEYFLIQDSDIAFLKPYSWIIDEKLNLKTDPLWNPYQKVYIDMVKQITGLSPTLSYSWVTEIMPVSKMDWLAVKELIQQRVGEAWSTAIPKLREFDDTKWFSEYELLGTYKTNQTNGWSLDTDSDQPIVNTWEEVYSTDWSKYSTIKFRTRPLKAMSEQEAYKLVEFLNGVN